MLRKGFTLIESIFFLLVMSALAALLLSILSAYQRQSYLLGVDTRLYAVKENILNFARDHPADLRDQVCNNSSTAFLSFFESDGLSTLSATCTPLEGTLFKIDLTMGVGTWAKPNSAFSFDILIVDDDT